MKRNCSDSQRTEARPSCPHLVEKLRSLERRISSEKGAFVLFGLFLRPNGLDKWDLLASAPWLEADKKEGLQYLANKVRSQLDADEFLSLSRIVLLEEGNPALEAIQQAIRVKHGRAEVKDCVFSGVAIQQAYIITSQRQRSAGTPNRWRTREQAPPGTF